MALVTETATSQAGTAHKGADTPMPSVPFVPNTASNFSYRLEIPSDNPAIETVYDQAFGPGRYARTAFRLRGETDADPALCFVAVKGEKLIATVRLTPIQIGAADALLLGPLAVSPTFKNAGAGKALVRLSLQSAKNQGHRAVMLVGDLPYYGPLGFEVVAPGQITLPGPVDPKRVLLAPLNGAQVGDYAGAARPRS